MIFSQRQREQPITLRTYSSMSTPAARAFLVTASQGSLGIRQFLLASSVSVADKPSNTLSARGGIAVDGVAVDAGSIANTTCSNCKVRKVGNEKKKCGFNDWCFVCDDSLWSTNPDVICIRTTASQAASVAVKVPALNAAAAREGIVAPASCEPDKTGVYLSLLIVCFKLYAIRDNGLFIFSFYRVYVQCSNALFMIFETHVVAPKTLLQRRRVISSSSEGESDRQVIRRRRIVEESDIEDRKHPLEGEAEDAGDVDDDAEDDDGDGDEDNVGDGDDNDDGELHDGDVEV